jgi:hypothetical protein
VLELTYIDKIMFWYDTVDNYRYDVPNTWFTIVNVELYINVVHCHLIKTIVIKNLLSIAESQENCTKSGTISMGCN